MGLLQFTPTNSDAICVWLTKCHSQRECDILIIMTLLSVLLSKLIGTQENSKDNYKYQNALTQNTAFHAVT